MADAVRTGRPMAARLRVRGWLVLRTPLHVGGQDDGAVADLGVAVDGLGRLYVPGTGLAGALRQWSQGSSADDRVLHALWGFAEAHGSDGTVSRVITRDALLAEDTELTAGNAVASPLSPGALEIRAGVGIDDVTGTAAAAGILYSRAVVPAGVFLRLELDVESAPGALDADRAFLGELLSALRDGQVRLGAGKTRGLGRVALEPDSLLVEEDSFESKAGLLALLSGAPSRRQSIDELLAGRPADLPPRRDLLTVEVSWRPLTPVLSRSPADGFAVATVPLTSRTGQDKVSLVLPGSGIKGALRSRAAWIERSVRGTDPVPAAGEDVVTAAAGFRAQRDELPAVRALFGSAPRGVRGGKAALDDDPAGAGAVGVDDCFATTSLRQELWQQVYGVPSPGAEPPGQDEPSQPVPREPERAEFSDELRDQLASHGIERADHVAIDRWTGGAADRKLFGVLEPYAVRWDPITITADLTRLRDATWSAAHADAALALLLLVLRDLADGWIPLGHGVNRGLGGIEVRRIRLSGHDWPDGIDLPDLLESERAGRLSEQWLRYNEGMSS